MVEPQNEPAIDAAVSPIEEGTQDYYELEKQARYTFFDSYYGSYLKEYGVSFVADEGDTLYDIVEKKRALVFQYQQEQATKPDNFDISLEPISLSAENGYRFLLKVKLKDLNTEKEESIPDSLSVNFIGGFSQMNAWWGLSSQTVDLSPLKTPGGTVETEVVTSLNAGYDKLMVQITSDVSYAGKSFLRDFKFDITPPTPTETSDQASEYSFDYNAYLQQNMLDQYTSLNEYYDHVIQQYNLVYTALETDTVYDLVSKKKAFVEQYQVLQASINLQSLSLDKENGYRFQLNFDIPDEYVSYVQTAPDHLKLNFIGGKADGSKFVDIASETIDLSSLETAGRAISVELPLTVNDDSFDQIIVQVYADSLTVGNLLYTKYFFSLPSSQQEQSPLDLAVVNEYCDQLIKQYGLEFTSSLDSAELSWALILEKINSLNTYYASQSTQSVEAEPI